MVQVLTDNSNRAVSEIRHAFHEEQREPGRVGIGGLPVQRRRGVIAVPKKSKVNEDKLTEIALEAGADDLGGRGRQRWEVLTGPKEFDAVLEAIKAAETHAGATPR